MNIREKTKKIKESVKETFGKIKTIEKKTIAVKSAKREVKILFLKKDANKIYLAGDFNNWDTTSLPMRKGKDGKWSKTLKLTPGQYQYGFLADDTWVKDLPGTEIVANPFGTYNCVLKVE